LKRVDGKYVYEKQVCNIQESTFISDYKKRVIEKKTEKKVCLIEE
jgi:hypothetical protein